MSLTPEERRARKAEYQRQYAEANKEKVTEARRRYAEANKEKLVERKRRYCEANKEKVAERKHRYHEANKEKEAERLRRYREANKEKVAEYNRRYEEANKEKMAEARRCRKRQIAFLREDGSSFQAWLASLKNRTLTFIAIANLQPNPGQTLAELIHELSGYAMEVCEQIANPPVIEDAPPAQPEPQPDLF
jgi:hypothetical protein